MPATNSGTSSRRFRSMAWTGRWACGARTCRAFSLAGGILGFTTGMALIWWSGAYNFKLIVGGKPLFSPLFAFPISYELTILFTAFATIIGMFVLNRLPMHYHAVLKQAHFQRATDDRFFIVIEARDPHYDAAATRALLGQARRPGDRRAGRVSHALRLPGDRLPRGAGDFDRRLPRPAVHAAAGRGVPGHGPAGEIQAGAGVEVLRRRPGRPPAARRRRPARPHGRPRIPTTCAPTIFFTAARPPTGSSPAASRRNS